MQPVNFGTGQPLKELGRRFLILIPLAVAMVVGCYVHIRSVCATYDAWTPVWMDGADFSRFDIGDVKLSTPGVVSVAKVTHGSAGSACVTLQAVADGKTQVGFGDEALSTSWDIEVRHGAILCNGVNFSGWESILVCLCIFFGVVAGLCASVLYRLQRARWFGYHMVATCGAMLFFLFQCLFFTVLLMRGSVRDFYDLAYMVSVAIDYFGLAENAIMAVLMLLVSLSNISLIRHEGMRPVNLLGVLTSVVWLAATWLWSRWWWIGAGSKLPWEVVQILATTIAVAMAYGECLLFATILCGLTASQMEPDGPVDYLIVLGCGLRKDGTPSPLLAGRVDRAREFDASCVRAGGAPATFVPSGGQGPDEVMPEALSMRNYLVEKGVDGSRIVPEDRSTTTQENMAFSRKVIEEHAGRSANEVRVGFSTTNYHVLRGYVCAHQAGMAAQGMGSRTRAYFWPNAFLREFVGLLAARWKDILITFLAIVSIYVLAEHIVIMM